MTTNPSISKATNPPSPFRRGVRHRAERRAKPEVEAGEVEPDEATD